MWGARGFRRLSSDRSFIQMSDYSHDNDPIIPGNVSSK